MNRYLRNIQCDYIKKEGQQKLQSCAVLVCGAGGLGSGVLLNLASLGVGRIGIVDFDTLDITNFNRQFIHNFSNLNKEKVLSAKERINEYNPEIQVETYFMKLDESNALSVIQDYDLIVDCFDSYESKFLLNKIAMKKNKTLIHGGISEFCGQVTTIVPQKTACLNCLFDTPPKNAYVPKGVTSPAVNVISSIQSLETLKVLLNFGSPLYNRLLCFDGLKMTFKELKISKNRHCPFCGK